MFSARFSVPTAALSEDNVFVVHSEGDWCFLCLWLIMMIVKWCLGLILTFLVTFKTYDNLIRFLKLIKKSDNHKHIRTHSLSCEPQIRGFYHVLPDIEVISALCQSRKQELSMFDTQPKLTARNVSVHAQVGRSFFPTCAWTDTLRAVRNYPQ